VSAVGDVSVFDVIVIGGGTAGMVAAKQIARAGKRVALVEAARTGGDCLYTGCVPSKSLIATARVLHAIRRADALGIDVAQPTLDLPRAVARKDRIIARIGVADSPDALERAGVTVVHGTARLLGPHVVMVDDCPLRAERLVIATGSRPAVPPIPGLAEAGFLTNEELMACTATPERLAVIGAGPVGLELGQAFRRFGSVVAVIERADRVLPRDDAEIAALVQRGLEQEGIAFHFGSEVVRVDRAGMAKRLIVRAGTGEERVVEADEILVATGRSANVEGLNLEAAEVAVGERGIRVDERLRTTAAHVWACGDVIGPPYFTHVADDQARTVARNVLGGRATWSGRTIPWATFTEPEAAGVGLTEQAARERYGDQLEVLRLRYDDLDRAITDGAGEGLIKVLLAPGWMRGKLGGEVVGAHVAGAQAGEIVQQFAFLLTWRLPAGMLAKTVQTYPTYSLGGRQAIGLHWLRADAAAPSLLTKLRHRLAGFARAGERLDA
jgi:pyruvate/2-oxoglutarate dehydrogenase complex dihydrolipoamide dehydrogenase (E3) component